MFEGAQGTLLDIDHGTYPFVTSSNCVAGNALPARASARTCCTTCCGITKAYTTRVGSGPFPTELPMDEPGSVGHHLSTVGQERGTVTGRARRCGWLDAAALKRSTSSTACRACASPSSTCSTAWPRSRSASATGSAGAAIDILPLDADDIAACEPIYESFPGWTEKTVGLTQWDQLPPNARRYLERVQALIGAPIDMVSTGPDRDHTILLRHPYQR